MIGGAAADFDWAGRLAGSRGITGSYTHRLETLLGESSGWGSTFWSLGPLAGGVGVIDPCDRRHETPVLDAPAPGLTTHSGVSSL